MPDVSDSAVALHQRVPAARNRQTVQLDKRERTSCSSIALYVVGLRTEAVPAHVLRGYACIVEITLSAHCGADRITLHSRDPDQRLRIAETLA